MRAYLVLAGVWTAGIVVWACLSVQRVSQCASIPFDSGQVLCPDGAILKSTPNLVSLLGLIWVAGLLVLAALIGLMDGLNWLVARIWPE